MDESITVAWARDVPFVGRLDRDGAAILLAANLRPRRDRSCLVVGDSVLGALHQLDPWLLDDIDQVTTGAVTLVASELAAPPSDGSAPPAQRISDVLRVEVTAPAGLPVQLGNGDLFVLGEEPGWVTFRPDGTSVPLGARLPAPWWQAGLPEGTETSVHIPAGLWLRHPEAADRVTDPLYGVGIDPDRPYLVVGAPGERLPSRSAVVEVMRALPKRTRDRTVLVSYGAGPSARIAQQVADELGAPVRAAHGVPDVDGRLTYIDRSGTACWQPYALESVYRPGAVPMLDRWSAPPRLPMLEPGYYRLAPGWRVEVVPRGLAVHPDDSPLDRTMLAADTGPTADLVIASDGRLPDEVRTALDDLIRHLPEPTRAVLRILPVNEPTADAIGALEASEAIVPLPSTVPYAAPSLPPPEGGLVVTADGRLLPARTAAASTRPDASVEPVASAEAASSTEAASSVQPVVATETSVGTEVAIGTEAATLAESGHDSEQSRAYDREHSREHGRELVASVAAPAPAAEAEAADPNAPRTGPPVAPEPLRARSTRTMSEAPKAQQAPGRTAIRAPETAAEPGRAIGMPEAEPEVESVAALLPARTTPRVPPAVQPSVHSTTPAQPAASVHPDARQPGQPTALVQPADPEPTALVQPVAPAQPVAPQDEARPNGGVLAGTGNPEDPTESGAAIEANGIETGQGKNEPSEPAPEPNLGRRPLELPEDARSTSAQRDAMRQRLGSRYDKAARVVGTLLSERPGLRTGADDRAAQVAELAVVRAFIDDPCDPDVAEDTDFQVCLADGLRRLPTARAVVVRGIPQDTDLAPQTTLRLPAPVIAAPASADPLGPAEALIWTTTGRRVDGLQDKPTGEIVLPGHTRLRVLAVEREPVHRVLLAEDGAAPDAALRKLRTVSEQRNGTTGPVVSRWFGALRVN